MVENFCGEIDGVVIECILRRDGMGLCFVRAAMHGWNSDLLERLEINHQADITEIPEWVGSLTHLYYLEFRYCPVTSVPDCICNLTGLKMLNLYGSDIKALPDDIGNLENLSELNISYTKITELPELIYSLKLDKFERSGLDID